MEKKKKKDQFVIAYLTDLQSPHTVVSHALLMARMLRKGLILLHISDPKYTALTPDEAQPLLQTIREGIDLADCNYVALKGETRAIIKNLPDLLNAVLIVAETSPDASRRSPIHKKSVLGNFEECKVAFLTVQEPCQTRMEDIALFIDFKKESKEKYIWSSYFARFNGSRVQVLHYDYKDEGLRHKWYSNMKFLARLYNSLDITFTPHFIPHKSAYNDLDALRYAHEQGYRLLISTTTKEKDVAEWFMGTQEERIIVNSYNIPILFLNPREDLYVLCD